MSLKKKIFLYNDSYSFLKGSKSKFQVRLSRGNNEEQSRHQHVSHLRAAAGQGVGWKVCNEAEHSSV